jgi:pectate lyase
MPHDVTSTTRQMPSASLAWQIVTLVVLSGFAATTIAGSQKDGDQRQVKAPPTVVRITDAATFDAVTSGDWELSGTLQVVFAGRIMPHEGNAFELSGAGVKSVQGRFEKLELPTGWLGDLQYSETAPFVVLKNLRPDRSPAFPGAEGFGKFTIGGRGGRVIEVVNLNDSGDGSFRAACEAEGPRTVVFRVSGTITLEKSLSIRNPYITIAGQTAPGDGICIRGQQVKLDTDHVIIRYLRFRPGDEQGREHDGFGGNGNYIMIDHCSVSWGIDEVLSINKSSNFSVQWCMATESLYNSIHKKGKHGYGGLWGGPGGSWHHNLLAHHSSRNPRVSGNEESGLMDFRNNVIYNWGFNSAYGGELWPRNWINNYYKYGPATRESVRRRIFVQKDARGRMYADGNFVWGYPKISADNWNGGIDFDKDGDATFSTLRAQQPFTVAPVNTDSAEVAFDRVLKDAGASLKRDAVDERIVHETRTGTAQFGNSWGGRSMGIIDSQADVGGWPQLTSKPAPPDTDHDGIPDDWEKTHGLDAKNPDDGSLMANGYTNLEHYSNSLVAFPD